jgi:proteasome accessory factor C
MFRELWRRGDGVSQNASDRLARMLSLVPYITRRPGVSIGELAREFAVSREQISADLDLLMVCGLPGYYPDDLIDVVLDDDGGTVSIAFDAGIERPVRLTADEAQALLVALRALAETPGLVETGAVHSALGKLEQLDRQAAESTDAVRVVPADPAPALGTVREALDSSRKLWMQYYTASRDTVTERTVDPLRILVTDGHAYLEAYCHLARAIRHFRIDRIDRVRVLDEPAQGSLWVDSDIPDRIFHPDPAVPPVELSLTGGARWVAEYYPVETVAPLPEPQAGVRVTLHAGNDDWLARLVLSLGGEAVVTNRPQVTELVARRAEQALAAYDPG